MAHRREADAYDYLATSKVSELTVAQLEQALENSFLNKSNIEFWKGPIVMHKLLEVSRTYPGAGVPIPEQSAIWMEMVAAGETSTIRPAGSEIWEVRAVRAVSTGVGAATMTTAYEDGALVLAIREGDTIATTGTMVSLNTYANGPIQITNSLYLTFEETGDANGLMILVAYHKVSM